MSTGIVWLVNLLAVGGEPNVTTGESNLTETLCETPLEYIRRLAPCKDRSLGNHLAQIGDWGIGSVAFPRGFPTFSTSLVRFILNLLSALSTTTACSTYTRCGSSRSCRSASRRLWSDNQHVRTSRRQEVDGTKTAKKTTPMDACEAMPAKR